MSFSKTSDSPTVAGGLDQDKQPCGVTGYDLEIHSNYTYKLGHGLHEGLVGRRFEPVGPVVPQTDISV